MGSSHARFMPRQSEVAPILLLLRPNHRVSLSLSTLISDRAVCALVGKQFFALRSVGVRLGLGTRVGPALAPHVQQEAEHNAENAPEARWHVLQELTHIHAVRLGGGHVNGHEPRQSGLALT